MIDRFKEFVREKKSVIIYLFVGGFTNLLDIGLYALLVYVGVYYLIASTISTAVALISNFLLHREFTFKSSGKMSGQVGRYLLGITFNYLISQIILYISVSILGIDELVAKLISLVIIVLYNYFLLQKWVFKK